MKYVMLLLLFTPFAHAGFQFLITAEENPAVKQRNSLEELARSQSGSSARIRNIAPIIPGQSPEMPLYKALLEEGRRQEAILFLLQHQTFDALVTDFARGPLKMRELPLKKLWRRLSMLKNQP
jgi:hypothetical protein